MDILKFQKTANQRKLTMVTCYDATSAHIINETDIDSVLIGDSAGMVMHGFDSTIPVTVDMMQYHVASVAKVLRGKLVVADLPFLSYQQGLEGAMQAVQTLMQAGAHAVKLEGCDGHLDIVARVVQAGVPVMGHLGLTPQALHQLGGYKVQGRNDTAAKKIWRDALALVEAGCFALVLECVPNALAQQITQELAVPTIGIGAGPHTSGQVLVWQDLLGLQRQIKPKFVKNYCNGFDVFAQALQRYAQEVRQGEFPCVKQHVHE